MKIFIFFILISSCSAQEKREPSSKDGCICTMEYNPVCGSDGNTYGNACAARCANVTYTPGECTVENSDCDPKESPKQGVCP